MAEPRAESGQSRICAAAGHNISPKRYKMTRIRHKLSKHIYALSLSAAIILTVGIFCSIFLFGKYGIIDKLKAENDTEQNNPTISVSKNSSLEEQLQEYTSILESPYMINVTKSNPIPQNYSVSLTQIYGIQLQPQAAAALREFIEAAEAEGISVTVFDGYRTQENQSLIYQDEIDKTKASGYTDQEDILKRVDESVEEPGYSEHQTGLAVDMSQDASTNAAEVYNSEFYKFALEHCADYGFIMPYTEESKIATGYKAKPWHFRYVGVQAAQYIMQRDLTLTEYISYLRSQIEHIEEELAAAEA